jgi:hypothetical protein
VVAERIQILKAHGGKPYLESVSPEIMDRVESYQLATTPQLEQPNLPLSITISSGITLAVTGFAAKWMFGQIVEYWKEQVSDLKKNFEKLDSDITVLTARDADLRAELSRFKCDISSEYVTREDWIRSVVGLENKLERMGGRIDDKFDRLIERLPLQNWERN